MHRLTVSMKISWINGHEETLDTHLFQVWNHLRSSLLFILPLLFPVFRGRNQHLFLHYQNYFSFFCFFFKLKLNVWILWNQMLMLMFHYNKKKKKMRVNTECAINLFLTSVTLIGAELFPAAKSPQCCYIKHLKPESKSPKLVLRTSNRRYGSNLMKGSRTQKKDQQIHFCHVSNWVTKLSEHGWVTAVLSNSFVYLPFLLPQLMQPRSGPTRYPWNRAPGPSTLPALFCMHVEACTDLLLCFFNCCYKREQLC